MYTYTLREHTNVCCFDLSARNYYFPRRWNTKASQYAYIYIYITNGIATNTPLINLNSLQAEVGREETRPKRLDGEFPRLSQHRPKWNPCVPQRRDPIGNAWRAFRLLLLEFLLLFPERLRQPRRDGRRVRHALWRSLRNLRATLTPSLVTTRTRPRARRTSEHCAKVRTPGICILKACGC